MVLEASSDSNLQKKQQSQETTANHSRTDATNNKQNPGTPRGNNKKQALIATDRKSS